MKSYKKFAIFVTDNYLILRVLIFLLLIVPTTAVNYLKTSSLSIVVVIVTLIIMVICSRIISNQVVSIRKKIVRREGQKLLLIWAAKLEDGSYCIIMPGHSVWGKAVKTYSFLIPYNFRKDKNVVDYRLRKRMSATCDSKKYYFNFLFKITRIQPFNAEELCNLYDILETLSYKKEVFIDEAFNLSAYINIRIVFNPLKREEMRLLLRGYDLETFSAQMSFVGDLNQNSCIVYSSMLRNIMNPVILTDLLPNDFVTIEEVDSKK